MSASHILAVPLELDVINDVEKLLKFYPNMCVLFTSSSDIWVLSIQSSHSVQQLANTTDFINSRNNMYLRNSNNNEFSTFINQSLELQNIDDSSADLTTTYSSSKITELFNTLQTNYFSTLQNDDYMYDDHFKYKCIKGDDGKISFSVVSFNSDFNGTTFNINNSFNGYDVVNANGLLNTSGDDTSYSVASFVENIVDSFNNLTNPDSSFELNNEKTITNCFNGLTNTLTIRSTVTSIVDSFNDLNISSGIFTITDSSAFDMSTCFVNSSSNFVCLEYPLVCDISGCFAGCSGDIIVFTDTASAPTHGTLNVIPADTLTSIEYIDTSTNRQTTFTFAEIELLSLELQEKNYFKCEYSDLILHIYAY